MRSVTLEYDIPLSTASTFVPDPPISHVITLVIRPSVTVSQGLFDLSFIFLIVALKHMSV